MKKNQSAGLKVVPHLEMTAIPPAWSSQHYANDQVFGNEYNLCRVRCKSTESPNSAAGAELANCAALTGIEVTVSE